MLVACVVSRQIVKQSTGTVYRYARWEGKHGGTEIHTCKTMYRLMWWFGKNKYDLSFLCPGWSGVQFDWQNGQVRLEYRIRFVTNYLAFLAGGVAWGTRCPHHDCELTSCYHDVFLTWGHYHNNIVLFYHDSPITRSHFMDPTDRAIKGLYCIIADIWFPNLAMCAIAKIGGCTRIVQVRQTS